LQCLVDSSVLIDLGHGDLLQLFFQLGLQPAAPDLVLDELIEPDRARLEDMGLERVILTAEELVEVRIVAATEKRLSLADWAAFIAARNRNVTLLTGDSRLRQLAQRGGVPVHGVLWVLDQIESAALLKPPRLATALRKVLAGGARLPTAECERRLRRWEDRGID